MDVRLPDGTILRGVPEGTTKADIVAKLQANGQAVPAEWLESAPVQTPAIADKPASVQTGEVLRDIPRQAGLVARTGLRAATALPGMLADAATGVYNAGADALGAGGFRFKPTRAAVDDLADRLGLPRPKGANERVITDAGEMLLGTGLLSKGADIAARAVKGPARNALEALAANPVTQGAGAVGAGVAGGSVREAGGGPVEQFVASLAGGIGAGVGAQGAMRAYDAAALRFTPKQIVEQRADRAISTVLDRAGVDWSQVPQNIKAGMREEVAAALNTGQPLNDDAVRRLLIFKRAKVTPTVGMLTQDPRQITREANLAKTGANSIDTSLQRLPSLQNQNIQSLLNQLDEAGAERAPDAAGAGREAIAALGQTVANQRKRLNALYSAARDTEGRSLPLEGGTFTRRANEMLDEQNVGSFLPSDIKNKMNAIATGKYPLTVDAAEQLKTSIGNLQRGSGDGNVRRALGLVRAALDETPLQGADMVNTGNLPAAQGTVPTSPVTLGADSIRAFNEARGANRAWMQRVEANPALRAVVEGVEPDQFVQRFVVGKGATAADVKALRNELTPSAAEAMRQYLVRHLKDAATNSTDDITKFSNSGFRKALRDIGDEKLSAFFSREQLQQLHDLGDAAKYMQAQPAGSAVNNSNSGALLLGRGYDLLDRIANKVPLGGREVIKGLAQSRQQTQMLAPRNALTLAADSKGVPLLPINPLVALTSPVQVREDKKRN